jgi:YegS/Rv2252/BmrU family lipid kinase
MYVIANENAGHGRGARVLAAVRPLLPADAVVAVTMCAGDARVLAAKAASRGEDVIVALGGDGTVNEVVNGIADAGFRAALGIIPGGGGNDLAWSLAIPAEPRAAVTTLLNDERHPIDVGALAIDGGALRYYVNTFGMGASGHVAQLAEAHGSKRGTYSYAMELIRMMFRVKPWPFEIETDNETVSHEAVYAQIANGRREGRVFTVAPEAELDDGLLDMLVVMDVPLVKRPWFIVRGGSGHVPPGPNVVRKRVSSARVRAGGPLPCHVDGEPFTLEEGAEARVEVLPGQLTVIAQAPTGVSATSGR